MKPQNRKTRVGAICKCGCGETVSQPPGSGRPRQWTHGHRPGRAVARLCICGCGQAVIRVNARGKLPSYYPGHAPSDQP